MVRTFRLSDLDRSKIPPASREKTLEMIQKFQAAQVELERVCKEKGIPVPVMIC